MDKHTRDLHHVPRRYFCPCLCECPYLLSSPPLTARCTPLHSALARCLPLFPFSSSSPCPPPCLCSSPFCSSVLLQSHSPRLSSLPPTLRLPLPVPLPIAAPALLCSSIMITMIRAMLATMMFTRVEGPLVMMALRVCTWDGCIHSCSHTSGHACVTCRLLAAVVANTFAATALTT